MCPLTNRPTDLLLSAFLHTFSQNQSCFQWSSLLLLLLPLCDRIVFGYFSGLVAVVWGHIQAVPSLLSTFSPTHEKPSFFNVASAADRCCCIFKACRLLPSPSVQCKFILRGDSNYTCLGTLLSSIHQLSDQVPGFCPKNLTIQAIAHISNHFYCKSPQ